MMTGIGSTPTRKVQTLPVYSVLPRLIRDPLGTFEDIGNQADGRVVRLDLGAIRP